MTTHGLYKHPLHIVWSAMIQRCENPNNKGFKNYGGRGIKVCEEWRHDFKMFYTWCINNGYKKGLSLERCDNDGNYSPRNCKYATRYEQNRNHRGNEKITHDGLTLTITDWAIKLGLSKNTLYGRLYRGWPSDKILRQKKFVHEIGRTKKQIQ